MKHVALIACSNRKLSHSASALELYRGERFLLSRAWAEKRELPILILSAKHGLVTPSEIVEPYDESLTNKTGAEIDAWARKIACGITDTEVVVLAEEQYALPLQKYIPNATYPLLGMTEEEQKKFLMT